MTAAVAIAVAIAVGAAAGLAVIRLARRRAAEEPKFWRLVLIVMQAIYLAFALVAGHPSGTLREALALTVFTAIAVAGARFSSWFLVFGLFAHGAWDLRHLLAVEGYVVPYYAEACIGFDWLVAAYVLTRAGGWERARRSAAASSP